MIYKKSLFKRIISIFMALIITVFMILSQPVKTKAVVLEVLGLLVAITGVSVAAEQLLGEDYETFYRNEVRSKWRDIVREGLGVISGIPVSEDLFNSAIPVLGPDPLQELKLWMANRNGTNASDITDEQAYQQYYTMFSNNTVNQDNDSITISSDFNSFLHYLADKVLDSSPSFYVYSFNLIDGLNTIQDGNYYNCLRSFLIEHQNDYMCFLDRGLQANPTQYGNAKFYLVPKSADNVFLLNNDYSQTYNLYYIANYDYVSWDQITTFECYEFDINNYTFNKVSDYSNTLNTSAQANIDLHTSMPGPSGWLTVGKYDINICFRTLNDLKYSNQGQAPYYINNSVYNDWSSSSGDYTVSSNNSNKTTYNDIINWNIQYEGEHGVYPTPSEIKVFIENPNPTPTPTPTGSPSDGGSGSSNATASANNEGVNITINNNHSINFGGSSLSDNTVSGNGVGGSGGNIFDFIGRLGTILGNLIKNLGSALVDLIDGISETISSILSGLTNIFTGIIEFTFAGLPEDIRALLLLGLSVGLIVSVVKILRG